MHQPATQYPSTSAPQTLQAETASDSQPAASNRPTSRPQQANNKQIIRQKKQQSSKEKPKQPNYK